MNVPSWWQLVLLGLGIARVVRLVGWDDLTIPIRVWLTGLGDEQHKQWAYVIDHQLEIGRDPWENFRNPKLSPATWAEQPVSEKLRGRMLKATGRPDVPPLVAGAKSTVPPVSRRRYYLSKLVRCPWCVGFWISLVWWAVWLVYPHAMLVVSTPFAYSELVGLVSKNLDSH